MSHTLGDDVCGLASVVKMLDDVLVEAIPDAQVALRINADASGVVLVSGTINGQYQADLPFKTWQNPDDLAGLVVGVLEKWSENASANREQEASGSA